MTDQLTTARGVAADAPICQVEAMSSGTRYHPYIDGLRAVAVLSVVLYHVGLPLFPGGFVGVDIFFVISGFLIINQIRTGIASGRFSFADFWARRVVRILPPYLLVVAASVVAAPFILVFADEYRQFGTEVAYSGAMVSNFLYLGQEGYFNPARDTKVLLHLWSLAVEEQFYLLAPIIMVLIWKLPTKLRKILIAALLAMSFAGCIYWTSLGGDRNYGFYLAPLRAWEFIIGGLVASLASHVERLPSGIRRSLPIAGLALIVFSVAMFTTEIPFPSYNAALPVFGAVLAIAGCISAPEVAAARVLSIRPIVFIGLVSYAWYLWHWPLLTLFRIFDFGTRNLTASLAMAATSFVLAVGTYLLIEKPLAVWRRTRTLGWRPVAAGIAACMVAVVVGILVSTRPLGASTGQLDDRVPLDGCSISAEILECKSLSNMGLLIGDSQASSAAGKMQQLLSEKNAGIYMMATGGCIPIWTAKVFLPGERLQANCDDGRRRALSFLETEKITPTFAIMFARWPLYTHTLRSYALGRQTDKEPPRNQREIFVGELRNSIRLLQSEGVKRVLIIGPTPEFDRHPARCLARAGAYGRDRDELCSKPSGEAWVRRSIVVPWIEEAVDGLDGALFFDPTSIFCDEDYCRPYTGNTLLFTDTNHISDTGMEKLLDGAAPAIAWAVRGTCPEQALGNGDTVYHVVGDDSLRAAAAAKDGPAYRVPVLNDVPDNHCRAT